MNSAEFIKHLSLKPRYSLPPFTWPNFLALPLYQVNDQYENPTTAFSNFAHLRTE